MPRRQTKYPRLCVSSHVAPDRCLDYMPNALHVRSYCTYPTPPYATCKVQPTTNHTAGNHLTQRTSISEDGRCGTTFFRCSYVVETVTRVHVCSWFLFTQDLSHHSVIVYAGKIERFPKSLRKLFVIFPTYCFVQRPELQEQKIRGQGDVGAKTRLPCRPGWLPPSLEVPSVHTLSVLCIPHPFPLP